MQDSFSRGVDDPLNPTPSDDALDTPEKKAVWEAAKMAEEAAKDVKGFFARRRKDLQRRAEGKTVLEKEFDELEEKKFVDGDVRLLFLCLLITHVSSASILATGILNHRESQSHPHHTTTHPDSCSKVSSRRIKARRSISLRGWAAAR